MADSKIVTKKTAAKPAAPTETKGASAEADKKVAAKKTAPAAAKPAPTPSPAPAKPVMSKAAAAAAAAKAVTSPPPAETQAPAPAKKAPARKPPGSSADEKGVTLELLANVTTERRLEMIREAAYYKAEKRNFEGGSEADDWAAAEREIDELLAKARQIYGG